MSHDEHMERGQADGDDLLTIESSDEYVRASGEVDASTAPRLAAAIHAAGPVVRLDLSAIDFLDSSGIGVLVEAHQQLDEDGGSLTIVAASAMVRRVLDLSGMLEYLNVDD